MTNKILPITDQVKFMNKNKIELDKKSQNLYGIFEIFKFKFNVDTPTKKRSNNFATFQKYWNSRQILKF